MSRFKFTNIDTWEKVQREERKVLGPSLETYQHFKTSEEAGEATETEKRLERPKRELWLSLRPFPKGGSVQQVSSETEVKKND